MSADGKRSGGIDPLRCRTPSVRSCSGLLGCTTATTYLGVMFQALPLAAAPASLLRGCGGCALCPFSLPCSDPFLIVPVYATSAALRSSAPADRWGHCAISWDDHGRPPAFLLSLMLPTFIDLALYRAYLRYRGQGSAHGLEGYQQRRCAFSRLWHQLALLTAVDR